MSRPAVVEHLGHYLQPQSLHLAAKHCRSELSQLKREEKEASGFLLLVGGWSAVTLRRLESHWKMLLIAVKREPKNKVIKQRECKDSLYLLKNMLRKLDRIPS